MFKYFSYFHAFQKIIRLMVSSLFPFNWECIIFIERRKSFNTHNLSTFIIQSISLYLHLEFNSNTNYETKNNWLIKNYLNVPIAIFNVPCGSLDCRKQIFLYTSSSENNRLYYDSLVWLWLVSLSIYLSRKRGTGFYRFTQDEQKHIMKKKYIFNSIDSYWACLAYSYLKINSRIFSRYSCLNVCFPFSTHAYSTILSLRAIN